MENPLENKKPLPKDLHEGFQKKVEKPFVLSLSGVATQMFIRIFAEFLQFRARKIPDRRIIEIAGAIGCLKEIQKFLPQPYEDGLLINDSDKEYHDCPIDKRQLKALQIACDAFIRYPSKKCSSGIRSVITLENQVRDNLERSSSKVKWQSQQNEENPEGTLEKTNEEKAGKMLKTTSVSELKSIQQAFIDLIRKKGKRLLSEIAIVKVCLAIHALQEIMEEIPSFPIGDPMEKGLGFGILVSCSTWDDDVELEKAFANEERELWFSDEALETIHLVCELYCNHPLVEYELECNVPIVKDEETQREVETFADKLLGKSPTDSIETATKGEIAEERNCYMEVRLTHAILNKE
ncbi:MAG: hypothetical protein LUC43_03885, partial [Burkholderiales bacterium]|nr:hypothetical protein [Burkholderiales bacterium]